MSPVVRMVGFEKPDLMKHVVELEAVGQPAEELVKDGDLAVDTGETLLGGGASPWQGKYLRFL